MRVFSLFLIISAAFGQVNAPGPKVQYAFVLGSKEPGKIVSLKDKLSVVLCQAEFELWMQAQKTEPAIVLYLDGMQMKGMSATVTRALFPPIDEKVYPDAGRTEAACLTSAQALATAAETEATERAAAWEKATKILADPAVTASVREVAKKDADEKETAAAAAAKRAAKARQELEQKSKERVLLSFYIDSELTVKAESREQWLRLLEQPWRSPEMSLTVGPQAGLPFPSTTRIHFERLKMGWLIGWAIFFAAAIILFIRHARISDLILDPGPALAVGADGSTPRKAYSLARTQMAVWTFLVAAGMAFIYVVTWNQNALTAGVLVLIGISFTTTLLSATADGMPTGTPEKIAEDQAKADLDAAAKAAAAKVAEQEAIDRKKEADEAKKAADDEEEQDKKKELSRVAAEKANAAVQAAAKASAAKAVAKSSQAKQSRATQGFWTDLLSDGNGLSFHRFQMVLFTLILVVIFVTKTAYSLVMPEFDPTLLGLMGISSGTYLGFKLRGE